MGLFRRLFRLVWGGEVEPALRPLLAVSLTGSLAGSAGFIFIGIWATTELGADKSDLGLAFLVGAFVSAIGGYVGGHLSDYIGRRPLILVGSGGSALYWLGYLFAGASVASGLVYIACAGILFSLSGGVSQAMVADLVPPERHEAAYASVRVAANLGVTLGPPVGGFFLLIGDWPMEFVGVALLSFAAFVLAYRYLPRGGTYAPKGPPQRGSFGVIVRDRPFLLFLASALLAWLTYVAYEVVLPVSLPTTHGLAPAAWGFLLIVNPVMVTFFQLRLTRRVARVSPSVKLAVAMPLMGLPFLLLSRERRDPGRRPRDLPVRDRRDALGADVAVGGRRPGARGPARRIHGCVRRRGGRRFRAGAVLRPLDRRPLRRRDDVGVLRHDLDPRGNRRRDRRPRRAHPPRERGPTG